MRRFSVLAILAAMSIVVSCGSDERRLILRCPSPDGAIAAVFWVLMSGPAAGSVDYYLSVVPSSRAVADVLADRRSAKVMDMVYGGPRGVRLAWEGPRRLVVTYPEEASLHLAAPGGRAYVSDFPELRVVYRGAPDLSDLSSCVGDSTAATKGTR